MNYLYSVFFGLDDYVLYFLILKTLIFILVSVFITWLIYFCIVKVFKKTRLTRDLFLAISFLSSLIIYFLIYNVYLFFLIKINGLHKFLWTTPSFYQSIAPQIIVYVLTISVFVINFRKFIAMFKKS